MLLDAFRRLLEPQCEIVGTACDGRALIELALKTNPEIIVLDISMPRLNGMDACAQLRHQLPDVKFVFLTVNEDADLAAEAIGLGASAYLLKKLRVRRADFGDQSGEYGPDLYHPSDHQRHAARRVSRRRATPGAEKLSLRQREVLQLLAEGKLMKQAADILHLTPRTIAFHKYAIMEQLGIKSSAELVQYAIEHHLVTPRG